MLEGWMLEGWMLEGRMLEGWNGVKSSLYTR